MFQNLLASLFGQQNNRPPMTTPPIVPSENIQSIEQYLRGPAQALGPTDVAIPEPMMNEEIDVATFKPKKRNIWEVLGDAVLLHYDRPPRFAMNKYNDNMRTAMEGFTSDPLEAIRRMNQVDSNKAWSMYNQHADNARADSAADSLADTRKERFLARIGARLSAAQNAKDPTTAYASILPSIRRYAQDRGLTEDVADLPDVYDSDAVNNWFMGSVGVEDQLKMEALANYRAQRLGLDERKFQSQDEYRQERLEDFDNQEAGRNDRAAARQNRGGRSGSVARVARDGNGNIVGTISKNGRVAKLIAPDGGYQYFEVLPNGKMGRRIPNAVVEKPKK